MPTQLPCSLFIIALIILLTPLSSYVCLKLYSGAIDQSTLYRSLLWDMGRLLPLPAEEDWWLCRQEGRSNLLYTYVCSPCIDVYSCRLCICKECTYVRRFRAWHLCIQCKLSTNIRTTVIIILQVCFRDVVFPLLPRMRGGLYYNTFIVSHACSSVG